MSLQIYSIFQAAHANGIQVWNASEGTGGALERILCCSLPRLCKGFVLSREQVAKKECLFEESIDSSKIHGRENDSCCETRGKRRNPRIVLWLKSLSFPRFLDVMNT